MSEVTRSLRAINYIPVGYLAGALHVAADYGYTEASLLRRFNIPASRLADVGNRINCADYYAVLDYLLEQGNIPGLGLLQASAEKLSDHGLMGTMMISSDNLRMAAGQAVEFQHLFGTPTEYYMDVRGEEVAFGCWGMDNPLRRRWSIENILAGWTNVIRLCLGEYARFTVVRLSYSEPEYWTMYQDLFNCQVLFEQERNEVCAHPDLLDIPFAGANRALRELCVKQCKQALESQSAGSRIVDQVEGIILASLGSLPRVETVAGRLAMSPRTLHRRLQAEGTTFRKINEQLRSRLARQYMGETSLEPKRVAYLLGYSEPANFYHAFQRWFGCAPLQYRERMMPQH